MQPGSVYGRYLADGFQNTQCRLPRFNDGQHRLVIWQTHPGWGELVRDPHVTVCAGSCEASHISILTFLSNRNVRRLSFG